MKLEFSQKIFQQKAQISSLIKILPVEAKLFHADRRTFFTILQTRLKINLEIKKSVVPTPENPITFTLPRPS